MQLAALKHRTESEDCFVIDHSHVKIRLHTAKDDVEKVIVHYTDNYLPPEQAKELEMEKAGRGQVSDYWTATLTAPYHRIKYTFEVIGKDAAAQPAGQSGEGQYRRKKADRPLAVLFRHI